MKTGIHDLQSIKTIKVSYSLLNAHFYEA
jgi:hypothetical protein